VLEGVARRGLLVVLDVVTDLEGGSPRGVGEFKGPGFTASDVSWQGCARVLPGLLDFRGDGSCRTLRGVALLGGGGSCRALRGVVLLRDCGGLAWHQNLLLTVYFGTPSMFITLWFGFYYITNPPLGTLII
jgi:hypothetical protein